MGYIFAFIVFIILGIAVAISQMMSVGKLEKEKLIPVLDSLYANPKTNQKHQLFIANLKYLDELIKKYEGDSFSYNPSNVIVEKLFRHINKYPNDRLGHERFMELISRAKQLSSEYLFQKLLFQIKTDATPLDHERLSACVIKARFLSENLLEPLLDYLERDQNNPLVQQHFLQMAMQIMLLSETKRQRIYNISLQILERNPHKTSAKKFVLNVGRWHFGKSRENGRITIYDEQRIQNDILARMA
ncbi:hypothetical protein [Acaryochloris sp. IP29b_bin.148]|uniref:hypothetical protein n=1 Tax=Acaryochloris sp. IP29b_bin.148 TaxID=2969218 RepID=UPI00261E4530|nr:hypothetical protein [Acaryochloris sp. IP29b_bin.148]